jgi:hypothetical protein
MIFKKSKFELIFWLKNLFKYKHGYAKNCTGKNLKKCPVCATPWPNIEKTPTEKYLESINYYQKYKKVIIDDNILEIPEGINGEELINIAKILKPEYDILTKGKAEEEVRKRGAL